MVIQRIYMLRFAIPVQPLNHQARPDVNYVSPSRAFVEVLARN